MITNYYGTVVEGSADLQTSIAGTEIIPTGDRFYNFALQNDQIMHISINNGSYIYVRANQGIQVDVVSSCKIQESGVTYNWLAVRA